MIYVKNESMYKANEGDLGIELNRSVEEEEEEEERKDQLAAEIPGIRAAMEARSKWETDAMKAKASDGGLKKEAAEAEE